MSTPIVGMLVLFTVLGLVEGGFSAGAIAWAATGWAALVVLATAAVLIVRRGRGRVG